MVDFLQKKKGVLRNTLEKLTKKTYLKTASVAVKLSHTSKLPAIKTSSVAKVFTPATYVNDKEVYLYESSFEVGIIVSMNGRDLDGYRLRNRDTTQPSMELLRKLPY